MKAPKIALAGFILLCLPLVSGQLEFKSSHDIDYYTGMDLQDNHIDNLSSIRTDSDFTVYDSSGDQNIARFESNGDFVVPNGEVRVLDNLRLPNDLEITSSGVITSRDSSGNIYLDIKDSGILQVRNSANNNLLNVSGGGNVSIPRGVLDMEGNRIVDLGASVNGNDAVRRQFVDSEFVRRDGDTMNGSLNFAGNEISNIDRIEINSGYLAGDAKGVQLRGDGGQTSGWFRDTEVYIGESGGADTVNLRGTIDITGGNLDLSDNSINGIGGLQGCGKNEFVNGNGNCANDDYNPDQNLKEVLAVGNTANKSIDMSGNNVDNVNKLTASKIHVSSPNIVGKEVAIGGDISLDEGKMVQLGQDYELKDKSSTFVINSIDGTKTKGLVLTDGEKVKVPNGNLDVGNNKIVNIGGLQNCGSNEFVNGNGNCATDDFDADKTIKDNQNLSYTNDNAPTSNSVTHSVNIDDGGSNIDIRDYYDPDTTIPDDQQLTYYTDVSGTNDAIYIDNGNNITTDDDFDKNTDASTKCTGDDYLAGDGGCNADTDTTVADNQDLGYNNLNSPTGNYVNHEVTITNGVNTDIRDYYDPDTTIADNQDLSKTNDYSGTDDRIEIDNGNNVVVDDDYDQNTNSDTECSGNETYLAGDGGCTNDQTIKDNQDLSSSRSTNTMNIGITDGSGTSFTDRSAWSYCSNGQYLDGDGDCYKARQNLKTVLAEGNSAGTYNIDMSGNNVKGIGSLVSDATYLNVKEDSSDSTPLTITTTGSIGGIVAQSTSLELQGDVGLSLVADADGSAYECSISESNGSWNCDGSKNFVHSINSTHDAYYTSQESADSRAVIEGTAKLSNGVKTVKLPDHFAKVVSDKSPELKVQVTPRSAQTFGLAVVERSAKEIKVKELMNRSGSFKFDYRVTGVREGYEDKKVVRRKE